MAGGMISEAGIRSALRKVERGQKTAITLTDPAPKGAGRLAAMVRPGLVEWYAQRIVGGKRQLRKLGTWPGVTIAQAREKFAGTTTTPLASAPAAAATFGDLVDGYIDSLAAAGKGTKQPTSMLGHAASVIGRNTPAADVTPAHIVAVIRPIYDRGADVSADKTRMWLNAAFQWGMKAEHNYRVTTARRWGIASNPVAAVPRDAESDRVGTRWLSVKEFSDLLHWATQSNARGRRVIALLALTGQRVHEITHLRADQWNSGDRLLTWDKTKNGLPHAVPVCEQAAAILDSITPNEHGLLFPSTTDPTAPVTDAAVLGALVKYTTRWQLEHFTGRDLRRTWKTLAGEAGLTKFERDLLQNHTEGSDVSSRHYDRFHYMPEKRAAVEKWQDWVAAKGVRIA